MKSKSLLFAIMALGLALFSTSCDKDEPKDRVDVIAIEEDPSGLINNFVEQMEMYNNGVMLKSGQRMLVDSAIWYIDAALNYTYASAGHPFEKLHRDTLYTEMSLVNGYEAAYEEVFDAYDTFLTGLSHHFYEEIEGDNKQFMMARVDDMGSLPGNKQKLRIITVTGTGTLLQTDDFGNDEAYRFEDYVMEDCFGNTVGTNAPQLFEALLSQQYNPEPANNCRWYFYGSTDELFLDYNDYPLDPTPDNYLDYKVFAASEAVANFDDWTECLEYNYQGLGIHEMQFYYDHLKDFADQWLSSSQNIGNKKFAEASINSMVDYSVSNLVIWHEPKLYFRKRGVICTGIIEPLPER